MRFQAAEQAGLEIRRGGLARILDAEGRHRSFEAETVLLGAQRLQPLDVDVGNDAAAAAGVSLGLRKDGTVLADQ